MDVRNGYVFAAMVYLTYLAVPVTYVDVVQAALCSKLHASATVANLPAAAYLFGAITSLLFPWLIPNSRARAVVVWTSALMAVSFAMVGVTLVVPSRATLKLAVIIGQALLLGILQPASVLYRYVCLGRGTTEKGRAQSLKLAYSVGPVIAVIASLLAQLVLNRGIPRLVYPYDFACLYFVGTVCAAAIALMATRFDLASFPDNAPQPIIQYLADGVKSFVAVRELALIWLVFLLWNGSLAGISNISLLTKHVLGKDPAEFSGIILSVRFGFKALAGLILGSVMARWGDRAPLTVTLALLGLATVWAGIVPGHWFLLAFGLIGAGELGGAYFPNYAIAASSHADNARNQAVLSLANPAASIFPPLYGILTDRYGGAAGLTLGTVMAVLGMIVLRKCPKRPARQSQSATP
jgi:hypothetical protein